MVRSPHHPLSLLQLRVPSSFSLLVGTGQRKERQKGRWIVLRVRLAETERTVISVRSAFSVQRSVPPRPRDWSVGTKHCPNGVELTSVLCPPWTSGERAIHLLLFFAVPNRVLTC